MDFLKNNKDIIIPFVTLAGGFVLDYLIARNPKLKDNSVIQFVWTIFKKKKK